MISCIYTLIIGPGVALLVGMGLISLSLQSLCLLILSWTTPAQAEVIGAHPGYLESTRDERSTLSQEVFLGTPQMSLENDLSERIFTESLNKEFQRRYEDQFGRTIGEQVQSVPTRYYEKELQPGVYVSEEDYTNRQRRFAGYMTKRLVEVHLDQYLKDSPSARPVYQLKETVSNVNVQLKSGYKVKLKYSLSGNFLTVSLDNPYSLKAKVVIEEPGSGGNDTVSSVGYDVTKTIQVLADYRTDQSTRSLGAIKSLTERTSTSLTGSQSSLEQKWIVGFSWRD